MTDLDPDALKQYQFLVFSKLEGAVTSGMIHLGDRLGLFAALAAAEAPLTSTELAESHGTRRALGARVGLQPGGGEDHRRRPRRALLADARGRRRAHPTRPRGVRDGHVPLAPEHDGDAPEAARELPQRDRSRLRQPRSRCGGRARARLRAVEPRPPGADRAADDGRRAPEARGGRARRRHRVRRRWRRPAARRGVPVEHDRRLRHLPARPRPGAITPRRRRPGQRIVPRPT